MVDKHGGMLAMLLASNIPTWERSRHCYGTMLVSCAVIVPITRRSAVRLYS